LTNSLSNKFWRAMRQQVKANTYDATLGDGRNNLRTGQTNYFYAQVALPDGVAVTQVLCTKITPTYGQFVKVAYNVNDVLEVTEYDTVRATAYLNNNPIGGGGPHGWTHRWARSEDPFYIDMRQVESLQVIPLDEAAQAVYLTSYFYQVGSTGYAFWPGGTVDLTSYFPTGLNEQRPIAVGLDTVTNTAAVIAGTTDTVTGLNRFQVPYSGANAAQIVGSSEVLRAAAVRLYASSVVQKYDIFQNLRQWGVSRASDRPYIHVRDEKANGSSGGTFTAGTWQTRVLNTIVTDSHNLATLAANALTVPSGVYQVNDCRAPAFRVDRNRARIMGNGSVQLLLGQNAYSDNTDDYAQTNAHVVGRFTLTTTTALTVEHYGQTTYAGQGFGVEGSVPGVNEIYTELILERVGV
jgi:hypothetical protein